MSILPPVTPLISRFDEPDGEKVTNNLNYVNNFVENVDIPVTFSLIPTQACIWADRLPAGAPNASQTAILEQAKAAVPGASWADLYTPCGSTRARTSSTAPTTTGPAWGLTTAIPDWPPPWATPPYP